MTDGCPGGSQESTKTSSDPASDVVDAKHATHVHAHCHVSEQKADVRRFGTRSLRSPRAGTALPRLLAVGDRAAKYDRLGLRFRVFAVTRETGAGMGLV